MRPALPLPEADLLWTKAIELDAAVAPSWSNRGTVRLQAGRWAEAAADLEEAARLEERQRGRVDPVVLNNLGNARGAQGRWGDAIGAYTEAAESPDPEMSAIALANLALARFQSGDGAEAVRLARLLLRRDEGFLDSRAALAAFLWGTGDRPAAESEWEALQQALDGLGGELYSRSTARGRVAGRWPPRPQAALDAFLRLSAEGEAVGYAGERLSFRFPE